MAVNILAPIVGDAPAPQEINGLSPESIARRRKLAEAMLAQGTDYSPVQSWTQGAARVAQALLGAWNERKLDNQESASRKDWQSNFSKLFGGDNTAGTGASIVGSDAPAPATNAGGAGGSPSAKLDFSSPAMAEIKRGAIDVGRQLGVDPKDLLTAVSYETGGTFDPWKAGPTTQWGQHRGLIQWGEPQRQQYGVTEKTSPYDQMLAAGKYLQAAGVQPGMGLMDIYSAINAGKVGRYNASDAGNGGAPGTVADKVNGQMAGHAANALALLNAGGSSTLAPPGINAMQDLVQRGPVTAEVGDLVQRGQPQGEMMPAVQVASANPNFVPQMPGSPAAGQQASVPMPPVDPRTQPQAAPQQVAQAAPPPAPAGGQAVAAALADRGPSVQQLMALSMSPWAPEGARSVINAMLAQKMQAAERANDPLRQLQIQQAQQALSGGSADEQALRRLQLQKAQQELAGGTPDEVRMRQIQIQKAERELNTPQKQWQKLDDGTLYDPASGEVKVVGQQGGGMFSGKSVDAQGLNWLVQNGKLTQEQAAQLAAGKTITDPQTGAMVFMTPPGIFGQSPGQAPQPLGTQQQGAATPPAPVAQAGPPPSVPGVPGGIALTAGKPVKATESEKNAMTYADRMLAANDILDGLGTAGTGLWDQAASNIPLIGNSMVSPEFQRFDQAKRDFINAQLRRESGAAIGQSEFENADKQYFPQRGDSPEVLAQKARNRKTVVEGMIRDAGSTYSRPAEAPAAAPAASQEKAPFPDGTRLRGPDGKTYIVKDGQPVPEQ